MRPQTESVSQRNNGTSVCETVRLQRLHWQSLVALEVSVMPECWGQSFLVPLMSAGDLCTRVHSSLYCFCTLWSSCTIHPTHNHLSQFTTSIAFQKDYEYEYNELEPC